jgi:chromosome segregation ATPase
METERRAAAEENARLTSELRQMEETVSHQRKLSGEYTAFKQTAARIQASLEGEIVGLKRSHDALSAERDRLIAERDILVLERDSARSAVTAAVQDSGLVVNTQLARLRHDLESVYSAKQRECDEEIALLTSRLEEAGQHRAELLGDLETINFVCRDKESQIIAMESEIVSLRRAVTQFDERVKVMDSECRRSQRLTEALLDDMVNHVVRAAIHDKSTILAA